MLIQEGDALNYIGDFDIIINDLYILYLIVCLQIMIIVKASRWELNDNSNS